MSVCVVLGKCFGLMAAGPDCVRNSICFDIEGNLAGPFTTTFRCTRLCQPWTKIKLDDYVDASLHGVQGWSAVYCNLYKTTSCEPPEEYKRCTKKNHKKKIISEEPTPWSNNSSRHEANETHADCGPSRTCTTAKEVTCAKVCPLMVQGLEWEPNTTACNVTACKPRMCELLAAYS